MKQLSRTFATEKQNKLSKNTTETANMKRFCLSIFNLRLSQQTKMKLMLFMACLMACPCMTLHAEEDDDEEKAEGQVIIKLMGDFHTGFGSKNKERGFDIEANQLGYEYEFKNGFSAKAVLYVGKAADNSGSQRVVYIKQAFATWEKNDFTLKVGIIPTRQFRYQEKFWGHRYIMKSFQDEYKFGSSADLGLSAEYEFADWISADATIVNGEGYKKLQINAGLNYGIGITLTPVKGLKFRLYGGINESGEEGKKNITNLAAFAGYNHKKFDVGAEYSYMTNASYKDNADRYGYSVYGSVKLSKIVSLYARFDDLYSKSDWNIANDESTAMLGTQIKIGKYVKVAPNVRVNMPKEPGGKTTYSAFLNYYLNID